MQDKIIEPINANLEQLTHAVVTPVSSTEGAHTLASPYAQWRGKIDLVGEELECYVLDTKQRVIALRAMVKAIADADSGDLAQFIGVSALNPCL